MNKDKQKELDDKFKKDVVDSLPDFIPDENKIDIADICNDIVDLLDGRLTNNTIAALGLLEKYYKGMMFSRMFKNSLGVVVKELNEPLETITEDETSIKSETIH